jgi:hypothetical protein
LLRRIDEDDTMTSFLEQAILEKCRLEKEEDEDEDEDEGE